MSSFIGSSISFIPAKICLFSSSWSGLNSFCLGSFAFAPPVGVSILISLFILFLGGDFCGLGLSFSLVHLLLFVDWAFVLSCSLILGCHDTPWGTPVDFVLFALAACLSVLFFSPTVSLSKSFCGTCVVFPLFPVLFLLTCDISQSSCSAYLFPHSKHSFFYCFHYLFYFPHIM